jgi:L-amino acid N-acyltransferase YncA
LLATGADNAFVLICAPVVTSVAIYFGDTLMNEKLFVMEIKPLTVEHWPSVKSIYQAGIATGNATFETAAPTWEQWDATHSKADRLVAIEEGAVLGWAALTPVSGRCVYSGVGEVSVYVSPAAQGKGVGKALLQALITASEQHDYWTLQAGIFPENKASVRLHEKAGFKTVGIRERIGKMNNVWRDVVLLERRSHKTGIN